MRRLLTLLMLFQVLVAHAQNYEPARANEVLFLVMKSQEDSIMDIERQAALEFNRILNKYRRDSGLDTVIFNNELWLASRNHALYMKNQDSVMHDELKRANPFFTGKGPEERLNYVQTPTVNYYWSGENCLMDGLRDWESETKGKSAKAMAAAALKIWKSSYGHNANMLSSSHEYSGTAFIIDRSSFWASSLFGRKYSGFDLYENNRVVAQSGTQVAQIRKLNLNIYNLSKQITNNLIEEIKKLNPQIQADTFMDRAAEKHAAYIATNRTDEHIQEKGKKDFFETTPEKRLIKLKHTGLRKTFKQKQTEQIDEIIAVSRQAEDGFKFDTYYKSLSEKIFTAQMQSQLKTAESFGLFVKTRRYKNQIETYIVILTAFAE